MKPLLLRVKKYWTHVFSLPGRKAGKGGCYRPARCVVLRREWLRLETLATGGEN